ncbi:MAG: T9SS type A sorting domain-containing protein [Bacteroidota bacterium]
MKKLFYSIALIFILPCLALSQDENVNIENQFPLGSNLIDNAEKTAIDQNGNVLVGGTFGEEVDFDPSEGMVILDPLGSPDLFVASYTGDGAFNWVFNLGRISLDNGMSIGGLGIDSENNVIVTGSFSLNVDFDPSGETNIQTAVLGQDAFVAKYSPDGDLIWVRQFGGTGSDLGTALVVGQNDEITFGIRYSAEIDLDPEEINEVLVTPVGGIDASAVRLDSDGNFLWSYNVDPDVENEIVSALAVTSSGEVVLGAIVDGSNQGGSPMQSMLVAVVNANGSESWSYDFMNLGEENTITHIAVAQDEESFYLGGTIREDTDFDPSGEANIIQPTFTDPFLSKHSMSDGSLAWATYVQSTALEDNCAGVHESNGLVFMAGSFDVQAIFDPNDFSTLTFSNGSRDIFITVYESETGAFLEAQTYGGAGGERANDAFFGGENGMSLVGQFSSSMTLIEGETIAAQGFEDGFLAKYSYLYNLSSQEGIERSDVLIYPIPSMDKVYIEIENLVSQRVEVKIINIVGQTVFEENYTYGNDRIAIDVSNLKKGIYLTEISTGVSSVTKRVIKK